MSRGGMTLDGRRGPLRAVVDRWEELRETPRGLRSREYEVLACGHLRRTTPDEPSSRTGRRHCLECVRVSLARPEFHRRARARYDRWMS